MDRVTCKQGGLWLVIFQELVADVAFIDAVGGVIDLVCQCWHLAKRVELQKPLRLLIKLIPQASFGVLYCNLMQREFDALFVEGNPGTLCERAEPEAKTAAIVAVGLTNMTCVPGP